jgi:hypothetical protein
MKKLLVILCSDEMNKKWSNNIEILKNYMKRLKIEVDYCGISNQNDFDNYEINYKYKIINTKRQFSKICDFITMYNPQYDWYMKIRPDIKLLENINFNNLSENAINGRARVYVGPKRIMHGMSVNGAGKWKNIGDCYYSETNENIVIDDMFFIFHNNVIKMKAFDRIIPETPGSEEWKQTTIFNSRNIPLNVIGISLHNTKHDVYSGDINMNIVALPIR